MTGKAKMEWDNTMDPRPPEPEELKRASSEAVERAVRFLEDCGLIEWSEGRRGIKISAKHQEYLLKALVAAVLRGESGITARIDFVTSPVPKQKLSRGGRA